MSSLNDDDDKLLIHSPRATRPAPDSALQGSDQTTLNPALSTLSTNSGLNILGVGNGFPGYNTQAVVPDSNVAVGTTQVVQFVNESFAVFNKSNGTAEPYPSTGSNTVTDGNTLWQSLGAPCSSTPNLDEIVQFDKLANVWVLLMPVFANNNLCIAVSNTSDFNNTSWNLYVFPVPLDLTPDYPKLAVWPDAYYLTYNQGSHGVFEGSAACALDRSAMLTGAEAPAMQCFTNTPTSYGVLLPGDLDGTTAPPSGSPDYFLNFDGNDASLDLWQFHVDWTTPANSWFGTSSTNSSPANIGVAAFTEACGETVAELNYTTGACIPQTGTTQKLDSYGDRLMYRLAYRNFGTYEALVANQTVTIGTSSSQTGVRWYELRNQDAGAGFGLYQQGTYAPDSSYRWMGSIAMDQVGDIALGYSVSDSTMSPSIRYTGRLATDPLGTMESEIDILSAAHVTPGSQTSTYRWADYSGMSIDPTDDCTFFYTTEYIPTTGKTWSTRIASFSFPSCAGGFTLSSSPSSLTVNSGDQRMVTVTVTPEGGFNSTVSFSCSGLPTGATCGFSPAQVTPSGAAIATQLTISVGAQSASQRMPNPFLPVTAMAGAFCMMGWRRTRRALMPMLAAVVVLVGLGAMSACNTGSRSGGGSTPTTSTVTVTATAGNIQQTTTISLTVN
ncbi:MAG: hypothetical protein WA654_17465 [Candidatus Sulfotelmatobacter sp.]